MKKILLIFISILTFFIAFSEVHAASACEIKGVKEVAKIVYKEVGGGFAKTPEDNFFAKLSVASVVVNHAYDKKGDNFYEKIMEMTNGEYNGYSTYRNKTFEEVVPQELRGEILYVSALVLSGKYNFPKEIIYQCSKDILEGDGAHEFMHIDAQNPQVSYDVYFGYSRFYTLSDEDAFGNKVSTNANYYRSLAKSLQRTNYESFNSSDVCNLVKNIKGSGNSSGDDDKTHTNIDENKPDIVHTPTSQRLDYDNICKNEDIKNAFMIVGRVVSILKIVIPIIIIVFGMIDFGKSIASDDDKSLSKAAIILAKRFVAGLIVFFIPTIIYAIINTIGVSKGIADEENTSFGGCTKCIFKVDTCS